MRSGTNNQIGGSAARGGRAAACGLVVLATLLLGARHAQALPAFGVSTLDNPTAAEYQRMHQGGVTQARISIYWQKVEPTPGAPRDWSSYDALFTAAASAGIRVVPLLHGSPSWVNADFQRPPIQQAWQRDAWSRFVQDFAGRYGNNGIFWKLHPLLPHLPPTEWIVWNEPNLRYFWGGRPGVRHYLTLLRITYAALKAGDPNAVVLTGGLFEHARAGFGAPASKFLARLYRLPGAKGYFDGVALHPFSEKPKGVVANVARSRRVMNRHGDGGAPILVDEFGWTVSGVGFKFSPFRATLGQQANRLAITYRLLDSRPDLGISTAMWFSWRDGAEDLWIYRMGLFDTNGQPRPAWTAFARAAGGTP
jgi:hypothetical protein